VTSTTIGRDTFQRANQSHWGKASDGQTWGGDANTAAAFSIAGNAGKVAGNATSYSAVLGPTAANADVVFSGTLSNFSNGNIGAILRWKDSNNWYKAYITGSSVVLQSRVNGTYTTIKTAAFSATAGTSYSIRFEAVGSTLSVKVWRTGTSEPDTWTLTATDTSLTGAGNAGIRLLVPSGATATVNEVTAISLP
jgi:hypothetical protein